MSAYMVDREHIEYLLDAAMSQEICRGSSHWRGGSLRAGDYDRAVVVGQMLWDANRRSIEARYPDTVSNFCDTAPGPVDETYVYDFHRGRYHNFNPVQVLKACRCFEYQACEYEEWPTSEACAFIDALMRAAVSVLPGYEDAEWGVPEPRPLLSRSK